MLIQQRPRGVQVLSPLMNQSVPAPEHCGAGLLLNRHGGYIAHF